MPKVTLNISPPLLAVEEDADAIGVSFPALLTAEIVRYRQLAEAATPTLGVWDWTLLDTILSGVEAHRINSGQDELPAARAIADAIEAWADSAADDDQRQAEELRRRVLTWTPLAVAGVLHRLRGGLVVIRTIGDSMDPDT